MSYNDLRKGRVSESGRIYLVTTVTQHRIAWFRDRYCARLLIAVMRSLCDQGLADSLAWILMPDHLHWLLQLGTEETLEELVGALKGRSARKLNQHLGRTGRFWQKAYFDHALRRDEDIRSVARYIVANPLRARLVLGPIQLVRFSVPGRVCT